MARNVTLERLITDFRAVTSVSLKASHNVSAREEQILHLERAQRWLWGDYVWPHLEIFRDIPMQAGQRYYAPPEEIDIGRITKIELRWSDRFRVLAPTITESNYGLYDSEMGVRNDPPQRWQIYEDEKFEIWPVPASNGPLNPGDSLNGTIRVHGTRHLRPLVKENDRADLDDQLIVLFAGASKLAADGAKNAPLIMDQFKKRYDDIKRGLTPKMKANMLGRNEEPCRTRFVTVYNDK